MQKLINSKQHVIVTLVAAIILLFLNFYFYSATTKWHFTIDDQIYHLMVRALVENQSIFLLNNIQPDLAQYYLPSFTRYYNGNIVAQYPQLYAFIAYPFYKLFNIEGLFLLNNISFLISVLLLFKIAKQFFNSDYKALTSCAIFTLAGFATNYSFSLWPHMLDCMLILLSFSLIYNDTMRVSGSSGLGLLPLAQFKKRNGQQAEPEARQLEAHSKLNLFTAGVIIAIALGVRLDSLFAILGLIAICIYLKRPIQYFLLGITLVLPVLCYLNFLKFGTFLPFDYGNNLLASKFDFDFNFINIALLIAMLTLIVILISARKKISTGTILVGIMLSITAILLLFYPLVISYLKGFSILIIDGVGQRKALLQSCPYLALLIYPYISRNNLKDKNNLLVFYLIPICYIFIYPLTGIYGGYSYNIRYLLPILPFTAIIITYITANIFAETKNFKVIHISLIIALLLYITHILIAPDQLDLIYYFKINKYIYPFLAFSKLLALILLIVLIAESFKAKPYLHNAKVTLLILSFIFAVVLNFCFDLPQTNNRRNLNLEQSTKIAKHIEDYATLISDGLIIFKDKSVTSMLIEDINEPKLPFLIIRSLSNQSPLYLFVSDKTNLQQLKNTYNFKFEQIDKINDSILLRISL